MRCEMWKRKDRENEMKNLHSSHFVLYLVCGVLCCIVLSYAVIRCICYS